MQEWWETIFFDANNWQKKTHITSAVRYPNPQRDHFVVSESWHQCRSVTYLSTSSATQGKGGQGTDPPHLLPTTLDMRVGCGNGCSINSQVIPGGIEAIYPTSCPVPSLAHFGKRERGKANLFHASSPSIKQICFCQLSGCWRDSPHHHCFSSKNRRLLERPQIWLELPEKLLVALLLCCWLQEPPPWLECAVQCSALNAFLYASFLSIAECYIIIFICVFES